MRKKEKFMKPNVYDVLAWIFAAVSAFITYYIYSSTAFFLIEISMLGLGLSICGMVFAVNAAKRDSPKRFFLLPMIVSAICACMNGRLFLACVMLNVMCGGMPFVFSHMAAY